MSAPGPDLETLRQARNLWARAAGLALLILCIIVFAARSLTEQSSPEAAWQATGPAQFSPCVGPASGGAR